MGILEELLRRRLNYQTPEYLNDADIQTDELAKTYDEELQNARNLKPTGLDLASGLGKGLSNYFYESGGIHKDDNPFEHVEQARKNAVIDAEKRINFYNKALGDSDEARTKQQMLEKQKEQQALEEQRRNSYLSSVKNSLGYTLDKDIGTKDADSIVDALEGREKQRRDNALRLQIEREGNRNALTRMYASKSSGDVKPYEFKKFEDFWENYNKQKPSIQMLERLLQPNKVGSNRAFEDKLSREYNQAFGEPKEKLYATELETLLQSIAKGEIGSQRTKIELDGLAKKLNLGWTGTKETRATVLSRMKELMEEDLRTSYNGLSGSLPNVARAGLSIQDPRDLEEFFNTLKYSKRNNESSYQDIPQQNSRSASQKIDLAKLSDEELENMHSKSRSGK